MKKGFDGSTAETGSKALGGSLFTILTLDGSLFTILTPGGPLFATRSRDAVDGGRSGGGNIATSYNTYENGKRPPSMPGDNANRDGQTFLMNKHVFQSDTSKAK